MPSSADILEELGGMSADPLGFVLFAFPWGEPGDLAEAKGPEPWQVDILKQIAQGLPLGRAIKLAVTSGHGIGKSALVSWIILWALSTFPDTKGVVTANTEPQLKTKTWAELAKWYRMFIGREFFEMTATSIYSLDPEHTLTWRADAIPWSEHRPESFAGLHNKGRRLFLIMDEGAAIPDIIYETAQGALTDKDTEILWAVFGNPTRNSGWFKDIFGGKPGWVTRQIDARTVSIGNQSEYQDWIAHYGADSDYVRIRVLGKFPRTGSAEFISEADVVEAMSREALPNPFEPLVMGVDVARFGEDSSVIFFRRGRDAKTIPPLIFNGVDTMALAAHVAQAYAVHKPRAIFVDEGGVGGGVVDRLRQLGVTNIGVQFGSKADRLGDQTVYANKRAEMWGMMREWLKGGALHQDQGLRRELVSPQYSLNANGAIQLERKEDMRKRRVASPDQADALALTFAYPVSIDLDSLNRLGQPKPGLQSEYNPFEYMEVA